MLTRFNIPPFLHFYFFIFNFLGVPLAASGFGSGYPLILAAYRQMVVLCLLAFPCFILTSSFFILFSVSYPLLSLTHPDAHASARTDNSRPAVRSKLPHQHQGNHVGLPLHFCAPHKPQPPIPNTNHSITHKP